MFPSRAGAGAAQKTPEDVHREDDEHQESVEKHRGAVCQLVSVSPRSFCNQREDV